jgi:parallel beta-helix repeat protein
MKWLTYVLIFIFTIASVRAVECGPIPTDGCEVTIDTTFVSGTYNLPNGINVNANDLTLDCNGSILKGNGFSDGQVGILISDKRNIKIKDCNIEDFNTGFKMYRTTYSNVDKVTVKSNGVGFLIDRSSYNLISGLIADANHYEGIVIGPLSHFNDILNCTSKNSMFGTGHGRGIYISESNGNKIDNCNLFNNSEQNIVIMRSSNNNIFSNSFFGMQNSGFRTSSSSLYGNSINNIIINNTFNHSTYNLFIEFFKNNTIIGNSFYDGSLSGELENNTFCLNCIGNNYYDGAIGPQCPSSCDDEDNDGVSKNEGDCNDTDITIFPGAIELCDNKDNDCDGVVDEGISDILHEIENVFGICLGYSTCELGNWMKFDPKIPSQEVCDGVDNNCDGNVDEGFDSDNDGIADCFDSCKGSRDGELVDQNGCDPFQFCGKFYCSLTCFTADFRHNELESSPHDCTVVMFINGDSYQPGCVPLTCLN